MDLPSSFGQERSAPQMLRLKSALALNKAAHMPRNVELPNTSAPHVENYEVATPYIMQMQTSSKNDSSTQYEAVHSAVLDVHWKRVTSDSYPTHRKNPKTKKANFLLKLKNKKPKKTHEVAVPPM